MAGSAASSSLFAQAFSDEDRLAIIDSIAARDGFGDRANIEEVVLHWDVDGDQFVPSGSNQDTDLQPLQIAADAADKNARTRRTQDPKIDGSGKLPGSLVIIVGAVGVHVRSTMPATLGEITAGAVAAADLQALQEVQDVLESSILTMGNGAIRRFELTGEEVISYGPSRALHAVYDADSTPRFAGQVVDKSTQMIRVKPFELGDDQQVDLHHYISIPNALPTTDFRVRYALHCLIARTK